MNRKYPRVTDGVTQWQCPSCKSWLSEACFFKRKSSLNGLKSHCKKCHTIIAIRTRDPINHRKLCREAMRRMVAANPEKFRLRKREASRKRDNNTPQCLARRTLNLAVKSGKILVPSLCVDCGEKLKLAAHHNDYTTPLDVEWLCYECHGRRHWKS